MRFILLMCGPIAVGILVIGLRILMRTSREPVKHLTDEEIIAHNETIIAESKSKSSFNRVSVEDTFSLIAHPTIMCRFNRTKEQLETGNYGAGWYFHGSDRSAVWRTDMRYPECSSCLVENPYE